MGSPEAERLRIALEMYEAGEQMVRLRLRREHPAWDDAEVEVAVTAWRLHRPGEVAGDVAGPVTQRADRAVPPGQR